MINYETNGNEVWADAEGTLMVPASPDGSRWWVFGVDRPISGDAVLVIHPLTKVIDADGNVLVTKLDYPNDK